MGKLTNFGSQELPTVKTILYLQYVFDAFTMIISPQLNCPQRRLNEGTIASRGLSIILEKK